MRQVFDPKVQVQLTCHSPEEFQEKAIGWDIDHLQLVRGVYRSSLDLVHTINMQLSRTVHQVGIRERGGTSPNTCAIALPVLSPDTDRPYFCGSRLEAEECPALRSGDEFEVFSSGIETYVSIVVNADLLNRECRLLTGLSFSSLVYSRRIWIERHDQQWLVQTILELIEKLKNCLGQLSIREQELLERQLVEQLLFCIRPPSRLKIKIPNRRQVAYKAEQLLRQNVAQHLSIEELCRLLGCSSRTLHLGFKERYGTTPGLYARTLALNAVWKQLRSVPYGESITEIAMKWGFYHLGRFSQQYRQLFDELPSATVKRNRELIL